MRGIEHHARLGPDAFPAQVISGLDVAGHRQSDQVRGRAAAGQQAAGCSGKAQHLFEPLHHLFLDVVGTVMVQPAGVGIHGSGEEFGKRAGDRARAEDPPPEPWMDVPRRVGQHVLAELFVHLLRRLRVQRKGTAEMGLGLVGDVLPGWPLPERPQVVEHLVHHAMAERAHGFPILGIQVFFCGPRPLLCHVCYPPTRARRIG